MRFVYVVGLLVCCDIVFGLYVVYVGIFCVVYVCFCFNDFVCVDCVDCVCVKDVDVMVLCG